MTSAERQCCPANWPPGIEDKRTDVPPLREDNAQEEKDKQHAGSNPAVSSMRSRGIEPGLVLLQRKVRKASCGTIWHPGRRIAEPLNRLTLVILEVCVATAVKGDCSGSGTSMVEREEGKKEKREAQGKRRSQR